MQSTGQASTQAVSLVPMQGSAITYAMDIFSPVRDRPYHSAEGKHKAAAGAVGGILAVLGIFEGNRSLTLAARQRSPLFRNAYRAGVLWRKAITSPCLAAGNGPYDEKGLRARCDCGGQRGVGRLMGQILLAGEEPHERPALFGDVIADGPAQGRVTGLERVEDRALRDLARNVELHFARDARQDAQMRREHDPDHGSVWTSTESTGGRSRTMGAQWSPASADA